MKTDKIHVPVMDQYVFLYIGFIWIYMDSNMDLNMDLNMDFNMDFNVDLNMDLNMEIWI